MSGTYLYRVIQCVQSSPRLRYTASGVAKQTGMTAAGTATGGILFGPFGALIGSIIGGLVGYKMADDYGGLLTVLNELPHDQRGMLTSKNLVGGVTFEQFTRWFREGDHQQLLLDLLFEFARKQLH
ncbi:unnamed protein product [Caenorhabditis auriculariae]|uniref:Uncharacterized protein n=1 Tax=Caenorhabditis auriculariae TaxID=2777116 RepID=A0A8S1H635_9PELO|nr:unnamed protein product [Caenorhabditis auriculariae]